MIEADRQRVRAARDKHTRHGLAYDSLGRRRGRHGDPDGLPTVAEARRMTRWVDCPVHGLKVGFDAFGLIGRCSECAGEAARAITKIETAG
jgi:hypothetical protein